MKVSEILRKLADVVASAEADQGQEVMQPANNTKLTPVNTTPTDQAVSITMLSPLQQDVEIQKKNAGITNAFDNQEFDQAGEPDELELIKKSAGVIAINGRPE